MVKLQLLIFGTKRIFDFLKSFYYLALIEKIGLQRTIDYELLYIMISLGFFFSLK